MNAAQLDLITEELKFKENDSYWKQLAAASTALPSAVEELIRDQKQTLVQIPGSSGTSSGHATASYDDYSYDYNSGEQSSKFTSFHR